MVGSVVEVAVVFSATSVLVVLEQAVKNRGRAIPMLRSVFVCFVFFHAFLLCRFFCYCVNQIANMNCKKTRECFTSTIRFEYPKFLVDDL